MVLEGCRVAAGAFPEYRTTGGNRNRHGFAPYAGGGMMSDDCPTPPVIACPECRATGRKVGLVALDALLTEEAHSRLGDGECYRFCKTGSCDVAYFGEHSAAIFHLTDLRVPIFQKSSEPSRLVCYCFEYKVSDIEDEVRRTGGSTVPDVIGQKCKAGLDRCEEMNPQGSCCLGNVRQVVQQATPKESDA